MESLDNMLNIGKEMKRKLFSIGVRSSEDLIRLGSKEVFSQLKEQYPKVQLIMSIMINFRMKSNVI